MGLNNLILYQTIVGKGGLHIYSLYSREQGTVGKALLCLRLIISLCQTPTRSLLFLKKNKLKFAININLKV
ncbi:hypothetical protein D5R40_07170 [Okeania hirsuta]|uniref:Uncharacterized protein n=1 Tax=Okeania hirsuta TaxID=1458930 RepID=A0A3N6NDI2_9CYAN|nr:hypothetical protein D5R40_34530 [Okeania hirsuta]RQH20484.1 hypothetical protein D4Z78_11545 [Okeania hirsuta]RQH49075.1 hypothetical protein D5R40_07170 [Okeania hirsuta]